MRALTGLGYMDEAHAFVNWLLHATRLTQPELRVLYDVYGNKPPDERTLDRLAGYRGSRPVRIGNLAVEQRQLDVYGEVIDAVTHFVQAGGTLDRETQGVLRGWGEYVCRHWEEPDEGIWEPRTGRPTTPIPGYWLGGARPPAPAAREGPCALGARRQVRGEPRGRFAGRSRPGPGIRRCRATSPKPDGDRVDATLLLLAWYGFEAAGSERMRQTYRRIRERLGAGDGLLYRYQRIGAERGRAGLPRRGRVRHLQLLGGGVSGAGRRDARRRRGTCSSGSAATPTTWGSSPRRSTRGPAPRWATFPRRLPMWD